MNITKLLKNADDVYINYRHKCEALAKEAQKFIDWEQRRYEIAKSAMQGLLCAPIVEGIDPNPTPLELARAAVRNADALIKELK